MNICLIGLGHIGALLNDNKDISKTHLSQILKLKELKIVGLIESNKAVVKKVLKKYKKENLSIIDSYSNLNFDKLDIIVLATPPNDRLNTIRDILKKKQKPKFIFFEKPLANCYKDGLKIISLLNRNKIKYYVNYIRNWDKDIISFFSGIKKSDVKHINVVYSKGFLNSSSHYLYELIKKFGNVDLKNLHLFEKNSYKNMKNYSFFTNLGKIPTLFQGLKYLPKENDYLELSIYCKNSLYEIKSSGVVKKKYSSKKNNFYDKFIALNHHEDYKKISIVNGLSNGYKHIINVIKNRENFFFKNIEISLEILKINDELEKQ